MESIASNTACTALLDEFADNALVALNDQWDLYKLSAGSTSNCASQRGLRMYGLAQGQQTMVETSNSTTACEPPDWNLKPAQRPQTDFSKTSKTEKGEKLSAGLKMFSVYNSSSQLFTFAFATFISEYTL